ncbi:MAG: hypothetical protein WCC12_08905 [Anaerolineales bacterium]
MATHLSAKITRILFKDYLSFLLLLLNIASIVFIVSIPLLIILLPLLIWRVSLIKKTIEKGEMIQGILASKRFASGEWIVWYVFKIGGQVYKVRNAVVAFRLPFNEKDTVSVAYDPQNPQRAFLTVLYTA